MSREHLFHHQINWVGTHVTLNRVSVELEDLLGSVLMLQLRATSETE